MIAIENLTKGEVVATRTIDITRADLIRYAGASGDFNRSTGPKSPLKPQNCPASSPTACSQWARP